MGGEGMSTTEKFISPHQFAKRLAELGHEIKTITVREWCRRGTLDARRIGGRWRIRAREVERIAEAGT